MAWEGVFDDKELWRAYDDLREHHALRTTQPVVCFVVIVFKGLEIGFQQSVVLNKIMYSQARPNLSVNHVTKRARVYTYSNFPSGS